MRRTEAGGHLAVFLATSGHSGVDRVMGNLLPALVRRGIPVELLRIRRHGPRVSPLPPGLRIIDLPVSHVNSALPYLCWYLRRRRPKTILSDKDRVNRVVLWARRMSRASTRVVLRVGTTVSVNLARRGRLHRSMQYLSIRRLYPGADAVIVPSRGAAEDLVGICPALGDKMRVVPSPVIDERLVRGGGRGRQGVGVHPWLDDSRVPVILAVGELGARKDFGTLVRAFAELRRARPCRLVILGEGRQRSKLEQLGVALGVAEDMDLPGFCDNPYPLMKRASVLVLSSVCEGLPVVLVEAMALGTAVVATDCPSGPRELLHGGRLGPLVPMKDPPALAAAIARALDHPVDGALLQQAVDPYRVPASAAAYAAVLGFGDWAQGSTPQPGPDRAG